jgi:hypothetical protein
MSIKLQPSPTFKFKVDLAVPGSEEPARFTLVGKHQGQKALAEWAGKAKEMEGQDAAFLFNVIAGWHEVQDETGKAVAFTEEVFKTFVDNYPGSGLQIFTSYVRELSAGRGKN